MDSLLEGGGFELPVPLPRAYLRSTNEVDMMMDRLGAVRTFSRGRPVHGGADGTNPCSLQRKVVAKLHFASWGLRSPGVRATPSACDWPGAQPSQPPRGAGAGSGGRRQRGLTRRDYDRGVRAGRRRAVVCRRADAYGPLVSNSLFSVEGHLVRSPTASRNSASRSRKRPMTATAALVPVMPRQSRPICARCAILASSRSISALAAIPPTLSSPKCAGSAKPSWPGCVFRPRDFRSQLCSGK